MLAALSQQVLLDSISFPLILIEVVWVYYVAIAFSIMDNISSFMHRTDIRHNSVFQHLSTLLSLASSHKLHSLCLSIVHKSTAVICTVQFWLLIYFITLFYVCLLCCNTFLVRMNICEKDSLCRFRSFWEWCPSIAQMFRLLIIVWHFVVRKG